MGKLFDIFDLISSIFNWFLSFFHQIWSIITIVHNGALACLFGCPPSLVAFFALFMFLALLFFVWRLIP